MCNDVVGCPCYTQKRRIWRAEELREDPMELFRRLVASPGSDDAAAQQPRPDRRVSIAAALRTQAKRPQAIKKGGPDDPLLVK